MSVNKKAKGENMDPAVEEKCVNTIRILSADVVEKAKSGHPGAPMGCAPMAYTLWTKVMNYNPASPKWMGRDRFVLSNGHACALLYSMLHLTGYDVSMDDLKQFRQIDSMTPGHPENFVTPGVEVSTGPLGQGISNAVGLAIAEANLAATFNRDNYDIIDNYTYVICGDGCLQEGVSSEASSLAGHLGLGKLIVLYDDNKITIDGHTDLSFTEDVKMRYESYGWHVSVMDDVNDLSQLLAKIEEAKAITDKPSMIKISTIIGHGSSKENTHGVHGAPLGKDDLAATKKKFGFNPEASFSVDNDMYSIFDAKLVGKEKEEKWNAMFAEYQSKYPDLASDLTRRINMELPEDFLSALPSYAPSDPKKATRQFSQLSLNAVADACTEIIGGSADLTPSNLTLLKCSGDFQRATPLGRYLRFGVREHGMAAICNGMFAYGALRPYCATFLNFIGYAMGSVRLSALSQFGVIYVMTHDSIGLGEDGPTHQPVETLEMLRATPNLFCMRPADGNETTAAYACAMQHPKTPSVLCFSRQGTPNLEGSSIEGFYKGAYVLQDCEGTADIVLVGSGTEVAMTVNAKAQLADKKVRIVSMPCWELFEMQDMAYQLSVFPEGIPVMSVEASGIHGWTKYAHASLGLTRFGCSAPIKDVYAKFGLTEDNVAVQARKVIDFYGGKAPSLINVPKISLYFNGGH